MSSTATGSLTEAAARGAREAHEKAWHEELPKLRRVRDEPDRHDRCEHGEEEDDAAAQAVGPDAERHASERAGEHRHRGDQAEFGIGEMELLLEWNAEDREHHPDGKADREREGARAEHAPCTAIGYGIRLWGWGGFHDVSSCRRLT